MQALSTPTIASLKLTARPAAGDPFDIVVEIGTPYPGDRCWTCPSALFGLYDTPFQSHGEDSLQALSLANWLVGEILRAFVEEGGLLEHPDGSAFPLGAYKFGLDPVRQRPDDGPPKP